MTTLIESVMLQRKSDLRASQKVVRDILSHKQMRYTCDANREYTITYPIGEVVGNVLCGGCGKFHKLTPGKLSEEDKVYLSELKNLIDEEESISIGSETT